MNPPTTILDEMVFLHRLGIPADTLTAMTDDEVHDAAVILSKSVAADMLALGDAVAEMRAAIASTPLGKFVQRLADRLVQHLDSQETNQ